ncbi:hypothetical protein [Ramlibacter humi]|uniref:Uncharacterized protein n=1 Tax=Ramlibacter humi TaxID=2530451 RepID=A0A4Z0BG79_9BURK|nr:hypothetical protein [Ramlibacter humi]TFY98325.1 hypothetical protein EZ216_17200 [Ramlibacter humi]
MGAISVRFDNSEQGQNLLRRYVQEYYAVRGRSCFPFAETKNEEWEWYYFHYLIDRRTVMRVFLGTDRGILLLGIELGIGPAYFAPEQFQGSSAGFTSEPSEAGVVQNLAALDRYLSETK